MLSKGTRRRPRPRSPSRLASAPLVTRVTVIRMPSTSVKVALKSRAGSPSSRPPPNPPMPTRPGLAAMTASRHPARRVECRMYPPSDWAEGARGARALLAARPGGFNPGGGSGTAGGGGGGARGGGGGAGGGGGERGGGGGGGARGALRGRGAGGRTKPPVSAAPKGGGGGPPASPHRRLGSRS